MLMLYVILANIQARVALYILGCVRGGLVFSALACGKAAHNPPCTRVDPQIKTPSACKPVSVSVSAPASSRFPALKIKK